MIAVLRDINPESLFWGGVILLPMVVAGSIAVHIAKGRARRVSQFTGTRAFLAFGNTTTGLDRLLTADGFAPPFYPVITVNRGVLEVWRSVRQGEPIITVPVSAISVTVGSQLSSVRHPCLVLRIEGIPTPVYLSVYGDEWWALMPTRYRSLDTLGRAIGLIGARDDVNS